MRLFAPLVLSLFILARSSASPDEAQAQPPPETSRPWVLTFHDEFDTLRLLDRQRGSKGWRTEYGNGGEGSLSSRTLLTSGEREVYVDPAFKGTTKAPLGLNPFETLGGVVSIVARRVDPDTSTKIWDRPFTSGLLTSKFLYSQQYGYFEFRARLPRGKGLWPALWLLPMDNTWPPEIDIMEGLGDPSVVYMTPHSRAGGKRASDTVAVKIKTRPDGFHVFGLLWDEHQLVWYVDGVEARRAPTPADMHKPMYMLINLAVGGSWPGYPDKDFSVARMDVDYVRVWSSGPKAVPVADAAGVPQPTFDGPEPSLVEMLSQAPPGPGQSDSVSERLAAMQTSVRTAMGRGALSREQARGLYAELHQVALSYRGVKYGGGGLTDAKAATFNAQLDKIQAKIDGGSAN